MIQYTDNASGMYGGFPDSFLKSLISGVQIGSHWIMCWRFQEELFNLEHKVFVGRVTEIILMNVGLFFFFLFEQGSGLNKMLYLLYL